MADDDLTTPPPAPPVAAPAAPALRFPTTPGFATSTTAATPTTLAGTGRKTGNWMYDYTPSNANHVELSDDQLRQKYASNFFAPSKSGAAPQTNMDDVRQYDRWMQYLNGDATSQQAIALPGSAKDPAQAAFNQRMGNAWDQLLQQDPSLRSQLPSDLAVNQQGKVQQYDSSTHSRDAQGNLQERTVWGKHPWMLGLAAAGGGIAAPFVGGAMGAT